MALGALPFFFFSISLPLFLQREWAFPVRTISYGPFSQNALFPNPVPGFNFDSLSVLPFRSALLLSEV